MTETKGRKRGAGRPRTPRPVEDLLPLLEGVKQLSGKRWLAKCPAHCDDTPSLSIREGQGRMVLLHCFAGCDTEAVLSAIGWQMHDLYPEGSHLHRVVRAAGIPPRDALIAIDHEALIVALVASDVLHRKAIDQATWDRLAVAVRRIGQARDVVTWGRKWQTH